LNSNKINQNSKDKIIENKPKKQSINMKDIKINVEKMFGNKLNTQWTKLQSIHKNLLKPPSKEEVKEP